MILFMWLPHEENRNRENPYPYVLKFNTHIGDGVRYHLTRLHLDRLKPH